MGKEFNRFCCDFREINFLDSNNNKVSYSDSDKQNQDSFFQRKLKIGDIVSIKNTNYLVQIKSVDYEIEGLGIIDYAGVDITNSREELILFSQKDIESQIDIESIENVDVKNHRL